MECIVISCASLMFLKDISCASLMFLKDHFTVGGMFCLSTLLHVVRSCTNVFIILLYTSTNASCASFFGFKLFSKHFF